jgi:hypothetical protein
MGYNQRNDEIRDNMDRMRHEREAYADALATVEQFNARLSAKKSAWFWPTIAAALTSKHHWLIIACDRCDTVIDLDLTVNFSASAISSLSGGKPRHVRSALFMLKPLCFS